MLKIVSFLLLSAAHFLTVTIASAAESNIILVLDGSGSMWGQINSRHKIEIAREVIGQILDETPADQRLGLVAYGHNRKGDCADIEELAAVGSDRQTIRKAINQLSPKGKTPLSAAVQFAAEKLRYTEEAATVILVSDGIETCAADPCAVGTALEAAGVNFTAHVVGFDVNDAETKAQLACLAENTGGQFISAANAAELTTALTTTVAQATPPEPPEQPKSATIILRATELAGGVEIDSGLTWRVQQAGGGDVLFDTSDAGKTETTVPAGVYDIFVERPAFEQTGKAELIELRPGSSEIVTVALDIALSASVRTVPEGNAPVNSDIVVYWEGPDRKSDYVTIVPKGAKEGAYKNYKYTNQGQPLKLRVPAEAGDYEIRYVLGQPTKVLASVALSATTVQASLEAPEEVSAGSSFQVTWQGPGANNDWVTIVKPDAKETAYKSYAYTKQPTVKLNAELEAGDYEIRYVMAGKTVLARRAIIVTAVSATLSAPDTGQVGAQIAVDWAGPEESRDWITVVTTGAKDTAYASYFYTTKKNQPGTLDLPLQAGDYELRYVQGGKKVLARRAITIKEATATLSLPEQKTAGTAAEIAWTGPDSKGDFIAAVKPDAPEHTAKHYFYTRKGSPGILNLPLEPGSYELRYVLRGKRVIARQPIEIQAAQASLTAPSEIIAEAPLTVDWTGPGAYHDLITIAQPDTKAGKFITYRYTRQGSPAKLKTPKEPGTYELRYVLGGKKIIHSQPLTVIAGE